MFETHCQEMIDSVDVALLGRKAYEVLAAYWPEAEKNPKSPADLAFARKMNRLEKIVISRTLERPAWENTRVVGDGLAETIRELRSREGKSMVVWAGAHAVRSLLELGVLDELRLLVHPILLGRGARLFEGIGRRYVLEPLRTTATSSGVVVLYYKVKHT